VQPPRPGYPARREAAVSSQETDEELINPRRKGRVFLGSLAVVAVLGSGVGAINWFEGQPILSLPGSKNASAQKHLTKVVGVGPALPEVTTTTAVPKPTKTTPKPKPTTTAPKPSPTTKAKVVPPVTLTNAECIPELTKVTPLQTKIAQQIMIGVTEKSDLTPLAASQSVLPTEVIVMSYPKKADGSLDISGVKNLAAANKAFPAMVAIDQEGGQVKRLPDAELLGPDQISAAQLGSATLRTMLKNDFAMLKKDGITVNHSPVAEVSTKAGASNGRMFRSDADALKYLPIYNQVAKETGIDLTYKHYPGVLRYGNTDLGAVKTEDYVTMNKKGLLKPYDLLKGTNNLAMMGAATTAKWPNAKLDNKKPGVFNPAAYDALRKQIGDNGVIITDDLSAAKAVTAVQPSHEKAVNMALDAGADIAMLVNPTKGRTWAQEIQLTVQTRATSIEKNPAKLAALDKSFVRILVSKGVDSCVSLKIEDSKAYQTLLVNKQQAAKQKSSPTSTPKVIEVPPAVPGAKQTATTMPLKPGAKPTATFASQSKATATTTSK
jgi:beta-N-acetylhexosaminidase